MSTSKDSLDLSLPEAVAVEAKVTDLHDTADVAPDDLSADVVIPKTQSIRILVMGRSGSGKSTLVKGISGSTKVPRERSLGNRSGEVVKYEEVLNDGICVSVWDSPGLIGSMNQERYFKDISDKCGERDLTIFCISIAATRFVHHHTDQNPDVVAMRQVTEALGQEFWKNCIIALTFANVTEDLDMLWNTKSPQEQVNFFNEKIEEWKEIFEEILVEDLHLPDSILSTIKMLPAGDIERPHLPGCQFWLFHFWLNSIPMVRSAEVRHAMERVDENRFKRKIEWPELPRPQRPLATSRSSFHLGGQLRAVVGLVTRMISRANQLARSLPKSRIMVVLICVAAGTAVLWL